MNETPLLHRPNKLLNRYAARYRQTAPVLTTDGDMAGMKVVADCYGYAGWRVVIVKHHDRDETGTEDRYAAYWHQVFGRPLLRVEEVSVNDKLGDPKRVVDLDFAFKAGHCHIGGTAAKDGRMILDVGRKPSLAYRLSPVLSEYRLRADGALVTASDDMPLASPVLEQTLVYASQLIAWLQSHAHVPGTAGSSLVLFERLLGNLLDTGHEAHVSTLAESWLRVPLPKLHAFEATAARLYQRMASGMSGGEFRQFARAQSDDILLLPMLLADVVAQARPCDRPNSPHASTLED